MNDFAVFILSHGRAKEITTAGMLQKYHYTGQWFIVIDDEDEQANEYYERFGQDRIIMFDKKAQAEKTDTGDLDDNRRVGVFARNEIIDIAKRMGFKYHLQLDDDFYRIDIRHQVGDRLVCTTANDLDKLFSAMLDYLKKTPIVWLSFSLSSDFLGGIRQKKYRQGMFRKTMGSFLMKTDEAPKFIMRMNDDVTTTMHYGHMGMLFFSVACLQVQTPETQKMKGGMTEAYIDAGTYRKSFYSVMACPSAARVSTQGIKHKRVHHKIKWNNCCPKVLSQEWKK